MNDLSHHPLIAEVISHIAKQKTKRLGLDGKGYTQDEFLTEYGEVGLRFWQEAPHYECLNDLMKEWGVCALRKRSFGTEDARTACSGEFGVLFPGILLLIDVAHLDGKLKPSRLAPDSWSSTEIWDQGLLIGVMDCGRRDIIHVADFRQDAYECQELRALGKAKMGKAAEDFLNYLDGIIPSGLEEQNPIMKFLCVQVERNL